MFTIYRATFINIGAVFDVTQSKDSWVSINQVLRSGVFAKLQKAVITLEWYIEKSLAEAEVARLQASIEEGMKELEWHQRGILSIMHNVHSWEIPPEPDGQGQ